MKATYLLLALFYAQNFQIAHAAQTGSMHPATTLETPVVQEAVITSTIVQLPGSPCATSTTIFQPLVMPELSSSRMARASISCSMTPKEAYAPQVAGLKAKGVEFRVCRNTLKSRNLTDEAVIMEAQVVPSGVAEIGKLQSREGFVDPKP